MINVQCRMIIDHWTLIIGHSVYRLSQYDAFIRNVFRGYALNSVLKSPKTFLVPAVGSKSSRPWFHTRNNVEPGLYSHRTTTFELKNLMLKSPGPGPVNGWKRSS